MKTKSILMTIMAAVFATGAFSQSNEQGTIQVGLGWLATLGGGTLKSDPGESVDVTGIRAMYGLRAQYGLSENLSAGIFVRAEAATYVQSDLTTSFSAGSSDITYSGTSFGLEGKYYVANSDNFNFYPAIAVGYTTATNEFGFSGFQLAQEYDISGINYSVGVGLNWYFVAEVFGLSFDINYAGSSLSGTIPADNTTTPATPAIDQTLTNGSINWGFGLTAHFGGN